MSMPSVPPAADQSVKPSGEMRSAVAVATSTVTMAAFSCRLTKTFEPSADQARYSGSS